MHIDLRPLGSYGLPSPMDRKRLMTFLSSVQIDATTKSHKLHVSCLKGLKIQ